MRLDDTALILLASGLSRRFKDGDKLLADFRGRPLVLHAADALSGIPVLARLAVVGTQQTERARLLTQTGWSIVPNPAPAAGQGQSLALGVRGAIALEARAIIVLLADMPLVPDDHVTTLANALRPGTDIVLSQCGNVSGPPAVFSQSTFPSLLTLTGDQGARRIAGGFTSSTIDLDAECLVDVDDRETLERLNGFA